VALALSAATARAEPSAKELAQRAYEHFVAKEYEQAIELLEQAKAQSPAPTISLIEGRAHLALGRLVTARDRFREAGSWKLGPGDPKPFVAAVDDAKRELFDVEQRVAKLRVELSAPMTGVTVVVSGVDRGAPGTEIDLDPGEHRVEVRGIDGVLARTLTLAEREKQTITIQIAPLPGGNKVVEPEPDRGDADYVPAGITFGAAGGVLVLGAVMGGLALDRKQTLDEQCTDKQCPLEAEAVHQDAVAFGWTSTVALALGGAGLVAGTLLVVLPPRRAQPSSASLVLSPSFLGLRGRW
jgi:hypothetical protein